MAAPGSEPQFLGSLKVDMVAPLFNFKVFVCLLQQLSGTLHLPLRHDEVSEVSRSEPKTEQAALQQ